LIIHKRRGDKSLLALGDWAALSFPVGGAMRIAVVFAIACAVGLLSVPGNTAYALLIGLSGNRDNDAIYEIDPQTGEATLITFIGENASAAGLSFLGQELFASNIFPNNIATFGTIDFLTDGSFSAVGLQTGNNWQGLASNQDDGVLYTIDRNNNDILTSISPDGTINTIGTGTTIDGSGMAYDDTNGILYASFGGGGNPFRPDGLYTVDVVTGLATLVGPIDPTGAVGMSMGLAYDEINETLYANTDNFKLFTLNVATGAPTLVGPNNIGNTSIISLAWIPDVMIDIKPGDARNRVNICTTGPLSVAILGLGPFFDATQVDPATVFLAGAGVRTVGKDEKFQTSTRDVNNDGVTDRVVKIETADLNLENSNTEALLIGSTFDGTAFVGKDAIEVQQRMCVRTLE
jgi:hypothetical protein